MQKLLFVVGAIALMSIAAHMMMKESSKSLAIEESFIEYSDESLMEWIVWKEEHSKYYSDIKEEGYRLNVWMSNKRYIEENQGDTYSLGLNHYSDLTNEEWRALYLMNKGIIKNFHEEKTSSDKALPENFTAPTSVDWVTEGKTIQVLNQGQCGSCWAFSTVESIDSAFAVTKGGAVPNLSEQQVVSCAGTAYGEYGCNGGNVVPAYKYVQAHPLATAAQYPYVSGTG
jgi:cathepsin L